MQLKKYQNDTLVVIKKFFDALDTKSPGEAYESVTSSVDMIARLGNLRKYEAAANDTPTVAIKVPTGGCSPSSTKASICGTRRTRWRRTPSAASGRRSPAASASTQPCTRATAGLTSKANWTSYLGE